MMTFNNPNNEPEERVKLYLPSILGYEKIARGAAEALAEQIELAPARIEDLKTAVAEACMNAIEHGNNLERAINVTVVMTISPDKLEVRVADIGRQPIPDPLPSPGMGDMRGWGMFFIQSLVDEMEITRLPDGGNQIRMAIYLVRSDDQPTPGALMADPPRAVLPTEDKPRAIQPVDEPPSNHSRSHDQTPDYPASES